jgi:hypothetical protein
MRWGGKHGAARADCLCTQQVNLRIAAMTLPCCGYRFFTMHAGRPESSDSSLRRGLASSLLLDNALNVELGVEVWSFFLSGLVFSEH